MKEELREEKEARAEAKAERKAEEEARAEKIEEKKEEKLLAEAKTETKPELDKYALEVLEILKKSGNRLTQKELRDKMPIGEAKVSLIVAELEELGYVKKIKQGRGNIIVLKKTP
jgi:uncharacterized membrane protein